MAAGGPAAEGTGRHHNVREDIGLMVKRSLGDASRDHVQAEGACNMPTPNNFLLPTRLWLGEAVGELHEP